jgi:triosephosphate isomerase
MLAKLNVAYVIVGHSERREHFNETDEDVRRKLDAVFAHGMTPIVCVGETDEEREADATEGKVTGQVEAAVKGLPGDQVERLVVAYEPIWAIGTGKTATPQDAQETIGLIRSVVRSIHGDAAERLRIQYGGSVKSSNIAEIMAEPDVDGALVGGGSLDPDEFAQIVQYRHAS